MESIGGYLETIRTRLKKEGWTKIKKEIKKEGRRK